MAENVISGEIDPVEFTFARTSQNPLFPLQSIFYTCSTCRRKSAAEESWVKAQGIFYRGMYCNSCKEKEEHNGI